MYNYARLAPEECEFVVIGPQADLPDGKRLFVDIDGLPIVIFGISGQYFAIADVCSHDDGPLGDGEVEGYEVTCPRHGARFDIRTGKVLALPAVIDIPAYPVRIDDGQITIGVPLQRSSP